MDVTLQKLLTLFNREADERLARIAEMLNDNDEPTSLLDRLYQEFDSLYGAARAVNCGVLEDLFRTMAEYSRSLRRQRGGPISASSMALLREGTELAGRHTSIESCDDCRGREELAGYAQRVKEVCGTGNGA